MTGWIRRRLGRPEVGRGVGAPDDPHAMALAAALLYAGGGLIGLLTLSVPRPEGYSPTAIVAISCLALAVAAVLAILNGRLSPDALPVVASLATVLITAAIHFGSDGVTGGAFGFLYIWSAAYAAYFTSGRWAIAQVALIGAALVVLAATREGDPPLLGSLLNFASVALFTAFIAVLRRRMLEMIGRLDRAARTDPLTGLSNRRAFKELLDHELERARRAERSLSIAVGDLDHFKRVNDSFGHDGGDEVLCCVADTLSEGRRASDGVARLGGEEFALVMPESGPRDALLVAERLRAEVRRRLADRSIALTVSVGVASFPQHGATAEQLMTAADRAVYAAKALGRDRAVIHSAEVDTILDGWDAALAPNDKG